MEYIEIIKVIIIGVIEGITEWLPISSTGHMILADEFIQLDITDKFKEMFLVVIQLGAILSVCLLYFNKLNPFSNKKTSEEKSETWTLWFKVVVAVIPAAVIGLLFDDFLNEKFYNFQTVAVMLILYGVIFIIVENRNKGKQPAISDFTQLTYKTAFLIGVFQVLSLIPGTSRSGATIIGAMILGTSRSIAAEFTFFLAIPVMFGASLLKLVKFGLVFTGNEIILLSVGTVVSFLVSILAIKFLIGYIKTNDFKVFGYYRIVLGIVVILYFTLR
ncbi:MAG TPA: undecaprenyl-diphosphate phosphatase [Syntrophomonadaceae bacterium]|nr:undecaprenyl-diphosphate phosphatase [Syntrophomonadaceae bacterium]